LVALFALSVLAGCNRETDQRIEARLLPYHQVLANDCFDKATAYHHVNADILRAIAISNDPRQRATVSAEKIGTVTVGTMGINSANFADLLNNNVVASDLLDQCKNIYVGAWFLKKKQIEHVNTWLAVGTFQSETPKIRDVFIRSV
jgi:hypothetical protein